MMSASLSHFVERGGQLGPRGVLKRAWVKASDGIRRRSQALWWGWRARQGLSDTAFLARTTGGWRSMDAFIDHLAGRASSSFLLSLDSAQETAAILDRHCPEYRSALIAAADAACRGELSLLGEEFHFPDGIDWLKDPVTGWRWPAVHRSAVGQYLWVERQSQSGRPVDPILVWELNRHQHFITLGVAYWLTSDERYAEAFARHVESWINTNPIQHGVNWLYGLELSIRLIAWIAAFQFFRTSRMFRERTASAFLKSLWQQADFLSTHLQPATTPGVVPNNHLIGELTGLALVGAAFPEFRSATAWLDKSLDVLSQEVTAQTHPDGVNKEQATGYHRFVIELLLLLVARSRQGALPVQPVLEHTLEGMLEYVCGTMTPDGTVPMWGDSPSGRALPLGRHKAFWDFRPLLAAGAALFGRSEWKYVSKRLDEEAVLVLGAEGAKQWEQLDSAPPQWTSRGFPDGGLYVIRDTWAPSTDIAFFRCGPFGLGGEGHCSHAHCDLLGLGLYVHGEPVLVDSGTYMYQGVWRDRFRLTAAHNTVLVDGHEQAEAIRKFSWKQVPEAKCIDWDGKRVRGLLNCFGQVGFSRELSHLQAGVWDLVDSFTGHDEHTLEWFFHFAPDLELDLQAETHSVTVLKDGQSFLTMHLPDRGVRYEVRKSWYSEDYGVKQSNRELYARWHGSLDGGSPSFHWRFELMTAPRRRAY